MRLKWFTDANSYSTQKYPNARLNMARMTTKVSANATSPTERDLGCELQRQKKDLICKTSLLPIGQARPIPLAIERTGLQIEPLRLRNLTVRSLHQRTKPSGETEEL